MDTVKALGLPMKLAVGYVSLGDGQMFERIPLLSQADLKEVCVKLPRKHVGNFVNFAGQVSPMRASERSLTGKSPSSPSAWQPTDTITRAAVQGRIQVQRSVEDGAPRKEGRSVND